MSNDQTKYQDEMRRIAQIFRIMRILRWWLLIFCKYSSQEAYIFVSFSRLNKQWEYGFKKFRTVYRYTVTWKVKTTFITGVLLNPEFWLDGGSVFLIQSWILIGWARSFYFIQSWNLIGCPKSLIYSILNSDWLVQILLIYSILNSDWLGQILLIYSILNSDWLGQIPSHLCNPEFWLVGPDPSHLLNPDFWLVGPGLSPFSIVYSMYCTSIELTYVLISTHKKHDTTLAFQFIIVDDVPIIINPND